jgi:hypothetical protein
MVKCYSIYIRDPDNKVISSKFTLMEYMSYRIPRMGRFEIGYFKSCGLITVENK